MASAVNLTRFVSYWSKSPSTIILCRSRFRIFRVPVTKQLRERTATTVKTQGEIEAAVCEGMSRFEQEFMGRGPKDIRAHLIGNLLLIRLQGVLTAAEQHLVKTLAPEKG